MTSTAATLLLLTACGADAGANDPTPVDTAEAPATSQVDGPSGGTTGGASGACLEGATTCADFPTGTGGVTSQPDGSVLVEDAVSSGIDGPFLIKGWSVSDDQGARLCASLLESMPPQCGLPSIEFETGGADLAGDFVTEAGVTWSEEPVSVEGQVVDGVFVVGAP